MSPIWVTETQDRAILEVLKRLAPQANNPNRRLGHTKACSRKPKKYAKRKSNRGRPKRGRK